MNLHDLLAQGAAPLARVIAWSRQNLLVRDSLTQGGVILFLLLAQHLAAPRVITPLFARADRIGSFYLRRIARAFAAILPWLGVVLLAWFAELIFDAAGARDELLRLLASLASAWVVIRLTAGLVRNATLARLFAFAALAVAALNILHLLGPTGRLLGAMAITVGTLHLSVLLVGKCILLLVVLIWLANTITNVTEHRLAGFSDVSPAMQVLAVKLVRLVSLTLAVVLSLGAVGIDLTAFAVFSGAIGVGIGFGLQKVVSNLVSGVILLLDRSIKPGDVIQIDATYGWITKLNARYVSVATRDGTEYLIPNEDLITQRVINWSYSNDLVRLKVDIGIAYASDPHVAIATCIEAAQSIPRILATPAPICLLTDFGDSALNLQLRFWINDPRNGTANARSQVLLAVWDRFRERGIQLPFPQLDIHLQRPAKPGAEPPAVDSR